MGLILLRKNDTLKGCNVIKVEVTRQGGNVINAPYTLDYDWNTIAWWQKNSKSRHEM